MSTNNESESISSDAAAANLPKHYHPRVTLKLVVLGLALIALVVGVAMGVTAGNRNPNSSAASTVGIESSQQQMVDGILPFLQVKIDQEGNDKVQGTMEVTQDRELFTYVSEHVSYGDESRILFICDKDMASNTNEMDGWCGFEMKIVKDTSIDIALFRHDDQDDTVIRITNEEEEEDGNSLSTEQQLVLESFLASKVSEYFVGLTFKLGAMGKSGASNEAFGLLHAHAQWIVSTVIHDENIEVDWDLGSPKAAGGRRLGIHETSFVSQINALYIGASDDNINEEVPPFMIPPERKLGSCGSPGRACGNNCFGMCGPDCTCWAWACGDCSCYDGCRVHDYYCSCVSFWSFPCLFAVYALVC